MKTELVTSLKRHATKILSELHQTKEPVLITEHGKPSAYLLDVADYEAICRRMQILEGIAQGEADIKAGNTLTHGEALNGLSEWLK